LPIIEGSEGGVKDIAQAEELCKKIGFPVLNKPSGGGGGKGMKILLQKKRI
jgi:Biotin carboxylase